MADMIKVKLSEVGPNPFRNFTLNPIDPDHIKGLVDSINEHGFWTGVQVRKDPNGDGYQTVFGHRRFMAAAAALGEDGEVDVQVVDIDDEGMIRRLFDENFHQGGYASSLDVQEAVEAARDRLIVMMQSLKANYLKALPPTRHSQKTETWAEDFQRILNESGMSRFFCPDKAEEPRKSQLQLHLSKIHRLDPGPVAVAKMIMGESYRNNSGQYSQIAAAYEVLPNHPETREFIDDTPPAGAQPAPNLEALKHSVRDLPRQTHVTTAFHAVKKAAEGKDAKAEAARKPEVQQKIAERIKEDLAVFTSKSQRVKVSPTSGVKTEKNWAGMKPESRMTSSNIKRVVEEVLEEEVGGNRDNVKLRTKAERLRTRYEEVTKLLQETQKEWGDLDSMMEDPGVRGLWHAIRRSYEEMEQLAQLVRLKERVVALEDSNVVTINATGAT